MESKLGKDFELSSNEDFKNNSFNNIKDKAGDGNNNTELNRMKSDESIRDIDKSEESIATSVPKMKSTPFKRKRRKMKYRKDDKYIDFEQELFEPKDFNFAKDNRIGKADIQKNKSYLEEEKDVVKPLSKDRISERVDRQSNKRNKDFQSNISKMKVKEEKVRNRKDRKFEMFEREDENSEDTVRAETYDNEILNRFQGKVRFSKSNKSQSFKVPSDTNLKKRSNADPESDLFFTMKKAPRETKSYDHLQYGSHIILNVKDKVTNNFKKLCTKLRISEKLIADEMGENEYNINCMFCVLPTCQYVMHDKVLSFIEEETIPENIDVEFENFSSEVNSNSSSYSISIGKNVKYEETFQLYQDSSKRFLAFYSRNVKNIDKIFDDKFFGDECYYLGFSDYPGSNTHFKFETVANYQSEIDGYVKKDHFVYLTAVDQMKTHYLYSIENELVLTETHKTPISFKVIRDSQSLNAQRTVSRSNVFLLAFANDNLYLNSLHELNKKTGEYYEKSINFNRWSDINNIDFNGWWQIEYLDVPTKVYFRNFNSGKFLAKIENSQTSVFSLVNDKEEATAFELTSITNDVSDVSEFTENEIFKIKIGNKDTNDNYVCVEETDVNELFFGESETDSDIKRCILGSQSEENVNDSFKIIIPKEEKYLEISICIDSREYIQLFIDKLELSSDFLLTLVHWCAKKCYPKKSNSLNIKLLDFYLKITHFMLIFLNNKYLVIV